MAKLFILSALLSAIIFPGAAYWSGCKIPVNTLQRFYSSSVDHWSYRMQDVAHGLSFPNMPGGLLSCRADILTCTSVRVDLVPGLGLDVNVFLDTGLRCKLLGLDVKLLVSLCVKVRLRVRVVALAVDSCVTVDVKVQLPILSISLDANLLVNIIARILNDPCCIRAQTVCHELNYVYDYDDEGPIPFPPSCTTVFKKHKPYITARDLEIPCSTVVTCGGTQYPFPGDPNFFLPSVVTSGDLVFYIRAVQLNGILTLWRSQLLLDADITLVSVTTSTLTVHVIELTVAGNHICMIRIKCLEIYVALNPGRATLYLTLQLEVGYQGPTSYVVLLRLTLKIAIRLYLRIDCARRLMLLYVTDDISVWELTGFCPGKSCTIPYAELAVALGLRLEILKFINARVGIGIPWPLFRVYGCDSCSEPVCIQDTFYWPCSMRYPVLAA